jgi:LmbE family N-acetylglucosaminyl deacetylase
MTMNRKTVLSVAAHGDDAEFMAGGTLAQLARDGHEVYLCLATDNDRGSHRLSAAQLKVLAQPEAEASARALGAKGVFMLGYTDGDLGEAPATRLRGQVMRLVRQLRADIVFAWDPFAPFEDHPDHRAIAWAVSDAAAFAHFPLYHPEHLADGLEPYRVSEWYWYSKARWNTNKYCDIAATIDQKLAALYGYKCQMVLTVDEFLAEAAAAGADPASLAGINPDDFKPWIDKAIRARAAELGAQAGVAYAEAFRYASLEAPAL